MHRTDSLTIRTKELTFFVANCPHMQNPVTPINLNKLSKTNYQFGIILNQDLNHALLKSLAIPLYSATDPRVYYSLDVIHEPYLKGSYLRKKMRFIFIDIKHLDLVDDPEETFNDWLVSRLLEASAYSHLFFVSNTIPYYFKSDTLVNTKVSGLLAIVKYYANKNMFYISTDNDHYNIRKIPFNSGMKISWINYIMCGTMSLVQTEPQILPKADKVEIFERININKRYSSNSGYLEMSFYRGVLESINYIDISRSDIAVHVVGVLIRTIEQYRANKFVNKLLLLEYKNFALKNNLFEIYKRAKIPFDERPDDDIPYTGNNIKNIFVGRLVDSIVPEVDRIIGR